MILECLLEEGNSRHTTLETSLGEVMFQIIKFVNEKRDYSPPVPNLEGVSYPYDITIPRSVLCTFPPFSSDPNAFICELDMIVIIL